MHVSLSSPLLFIITVFIQINVYQYMLLKLIIFHANYCVFLFFFHLILYVWNELTIYQFIFNLQAVVVSIDPRRVYVNNPNDVQFQTIKVSSPGEVFSFSSCF